MNAETLMMHGMDWSGEDLAGWWLSEKFNGCRAWWDGARLWSRGGIEIRAPRWFFEGLPGSALDCELWAGYGRFEASRLACQYGKWSDGIVLKVFDAPACDSPAWIERIRYAGARCSVAPFAQVVELRQAESSAAALRWMIEIRAAGGEGIIARAPTVPYTAGRIKKILKLRK